MHDNYSRAIDAELRVTTLSRLDACGLLPATVETMCLRQYMQAIEGSCDGVATNRGTWINPLGIFHRTRVLGGLQVCPLYLAEDGIYRRLWRLPKVG